MTVGVGCQGEKQGMVEWLDTPIFIMTIGRPPPTDH